MMRQGANSAIRFTTYTTLKQFVQSRTRSGQTLPSSVTFGMGAIAGLITVYTTMPLECVGSFLITRRDNCIMFVFRHQCDQDAHAVARGTSTIPQFDALRISHLYRGGCETFLDRHNASTGTTGGALSSFLYPSLYCPVVRIAKRHIR